MMSLKTDQKKENKEVVLPPCRVSISAREHYKSKAKEAGISLSELQRVSLDNLLVFSKKNVLEPDAVMQLTTIGNSLKVLPYISNNLNQLARKSHIHDETDTERMREIIEELKALDFSAIRKEIDSIIMGLVDGS